MRAAMRNDLTAALKARDRVAVDALRSALAAIENAETPDHPTVAAGTTEVARRELSEHEVRAVVDTEIDERRQAAADYQRLGRDDVADRLRSEAEVLVRYLDPVR